jgi:hypothetical protein
MGTRIVRTLRNLAVLVILGAGVGLFAMQTHASGPCRICPCGGYRVCGSTPCPNCPTSPN